MSEYELDQIPGLLATVAGAVPRASTRITMASEARRWAYGSTGELNYLRCVSFAHRLYVVDVRKKTIFFVFHLSPVRRVLMEAGVEMNIQGVSEPPGVSTVSSECDVQYPALLLRELPTSDLDPFRPDASGNTFFLGLGPGAADILAVNLDSRPPRLRYSPGREVGPVEPVNKQYPLRPVVDLIHTLSGSPVRLGPPVRQRVASDSKPMPRAFAVLLKGYDNVVAKLAAQDSTQVAEWLRQYFSLSAYCADVVLRLTGDGTLARKENDEQFQVAASLAVDGGLGSRARLCVGLPDLVLPLERQEEWFHALLDSSASGYYRAIAKVLGIPPAAVRTFVLSARGHSHIVRCRRNKSFAPSLVLLNGQIDGVSTSALLALTVRGHQNPELDTESNGEVSPADRTSSTRIPAGGATSDNFFDLLRTIRSWAGVLS